MLVLSFLPAFEHQSSKKIAIQYWQHSVTFESAKNVLNFAKIVFHLPNAVCQKKHLSSRSREEMLVQLTSCFFFTTTEIESSKQCEEEEE